MKLGRKVISCLLSVAMAASVMCANAFADKSVDIFEQPIDAPESDDAIVITDADVESMVQTGVDAQKTGNPASTYCNGYTSNNCGRFAYGYCVNKSALGQKVKVSSTGPCTGGVVEFLQQDLGNFYFVWGAKHASEPIYTESYYYDKFASSTFVGSDRNFVIDRGFTPQRGDIMILGGSENESPKGNFAHVGICVSPTQYVDANGNTLRIYNIDYEGFVVGYFRFNTKNIDTTIPENDGSIDFAGIQSAINNLKSNGGSPFTIGSYWGGSYRGTLSLTSSYYGASGAPDGQTDWRYTSYQCLGFGKKAFEAVFKNYSTSGKYIMYKADDHTNNNKYAYTEEQLNKRIQWLKDNLQPGDFLQYGGHAGLVYSVNSNYIELYDNNHGGDNKTYFGKVGYDSWSYTDKGYNHIKQQFISTAKEDYAYKLVIVRSDAVSGSVSPVPTDSRYVGVIKSTATGGLVLHSTPDYDDSSAIATMPIGSLIIVDPNKSISGTTKTYVFYNGLWGYASKNYIDTSSSKINASTFTASYSTSVSYTGSLIYPSTGVSYYGLILNQGTDYTLQYGNNLNVGSGYITITGCGNLFTGTKTVYFTIVGKSISNASVSAIADQTYTGSALTPAVTVYDDTVALVSGTDYTVSYSNNVSAGTATVTVTGKGNYSGTKTATFKIVPKSISGATISTVADQKYTGAAITPSVTVNDGEKTLVSGTDYTVSYSDNINVGTATVTVTGKGNYTGTKTATFKIVAGGFSVSAIADQTYTGSAITPAVTVKSGTLTLVSGTDYTVAYTDNINAGTSTITLTGKGNYAGISQTVYFTILPKSISAATISEIADQAYTGTTITPAVTVKDGITTMKSGTDYTVSYSDNIEPGTATVTITGKGNYTGAKTVTFKIVNAPAKSFTVASISDQTYTGKVITPTLTVTDGTKTLVKGTDYIVSFADNIEVGTATAVVTGIGDYEGVYKVVTFKIVASTPVKSFTVAAIADQTYTGKAITPTLTVTDGTKTLVKGTDYIVSFTDNIEVGTATAVVTGIGDYEGVSKVVTFKIVNGTTPKPDVNGKVVVNDGTKDTPFDDLFSAMKSISTGSGKYVVTIEEDLTETKSITMPKNASSLSIEAPDTVTLTLKNSSLTSKCDLVLENIILVTNKGKAVGITAKKNLEISDSTVGALNVTGTLIANNSAINGKITAKGAAELADTTVNGKVTASSDLTLTDCPSVGAIAAKGVLTITGDETKTGAISVTGKTGVTQLENVSASGNVAVSNELVLTNCTVNGNVTAKVKLAVEGDVSATGNISTPELTSQDDNSVLSYKALSVTKNGFTGDNAVTLRVIDKNGSAVKMTAGDKKAVAAKTFKGAFDAELVLISEDNCADAKLRLEKNKLMVVA